VILGKESRGNAVKSANFREQFKFARKTKTSGLLEINFRPACTWTCRAQLCT